MPRTPHAALYAALVCGVNLPAGEVKRAFVDSGLIHVLVVSGAHLGVLGRLSRALPKAARAVVLLSYAWLTDFGPPIVRALVTREIAPFATRRAWSALEIELASSVVILTLYPPWLGSRSFLMSWICALALKGGEAKPLAQGARCYLLLYPFSLSAPLALGWNLALAPALGHVLFPACLAAFALPVAGVVDGLWDLVLWTLAHGPRAAPEGGLVTIGWLWWVPWVINVGWIAGEVAWRRARAFS